MLSGKKSVISEVLKLKVIWIQECFWYSKRCYSSIKNKPEWFEKLNEIYNKRRAYLNINK